MPEDRSKAFLADIVEASRRATSYVGGLTYAEFLLDLKTQDAVVRHLCVPEDLPLHLGQALTGLCSTLLRQKSVVEVLPQVPVPAKVDEDGFFLSIAIDDEIDAAHPLGDRSCHVVFPAPCRGRRFVPGQILPRSCSWRSRQDAAGHDLTTIVGAGAVATQPT